MNKVLTSILATLVVLTSEVFSRSPKHYGGMPFLPPSSVAMGPSNVFLRQVSPKLQQELQGRFFAQSLYEALSSANEQISSNAAIQITSQIFQANLRSFLEDVQNQDERDGFISALLTCPQESIANFCSEQQSGTTSTASSSGDSTTTTTTTTTTQSTTTGKEIKFKIKTRLICLSFF